MSDDKPPGNREPTAVDAQDMAHADIGLVSALKIELDPFLQRCLTPKKYTGGEFTFRGGRYDEARVAIVESGPGFAREDIETGSQLELSDIDDGNALDERVRHDSGRRRRRRRLLGRRRGHLWH